MFEESRHGLILLIFYLSHVALLEGVRSAGKPVQVTV